MSLYRPWFSSLVFCWKIKIAFLSELSSHVVCIAETRLFSLYRADCQVHTARQWMETLNTLYRVLWMKRYFTASQTYSAGVIQGRRYRWGTHIINFHFFCSESKLYWCVSFFVVKSLFLQTTLRFLHCYRVFMSVFLFVICNARKFYLWLHGDEIKIKCCISKC